MHEWPLMLFTLLTQASIGGLLATILFLVPKYKALSETQRDDVLRLPLLTMFGVVGLGMLASIFHLGNPWHMFYTITHVSTSWMSREVVSVGVYMGLLTVCVVFVMLERVPVAKRLKSLPHLIQFKKQFFLPVLLLTAFAGLTTVFAMSETYNNNIFVLWSRPLIYATYWGSTLITGGILACLTLLMALHNQTGNENEAFRIARIAFLAGCMGFILFALSAIALAALIGQPVTNAITPRQVAFDEVFYLSVLRGALLATGLFIIYRMTRKPPLSSILLSPLVAAIFIFFGEFIGRYVFFTIGLSAVH